MEKPAIAVLGSGYISYPLNRPVGAVYYDPKGIVKGRVLVLGSVHIFEDKWLAEEENAALQDVLFQWLLGSTKIELNKYDAEAPEVNDYHFLPDSKSLSEKVIPCLQECEELPKDFTSLFETQTFKFDMDINPEAVKLYQALGVKHEPLTLIPPAFETPLPPLRPAVFPPSLKDLQAPALDLYDLDEQFASEDVRLAHMTNRCNNQDVEYYIKRCGEILGVTAKLKPAQAQNAKYILDFVFKQITALKKTNNETFASSALSRLNNNLASKPPTPISSPDH